MNLQPESPTRQRFVVMTFLCVLSFLTYFDRVCITRAQKEISRDLNLTDTQMGLVFSAFWLAYALFELPGGWMGDRHGPRRTLTRIVLAWSLFTVLSGCATGFLSLLAFRFLFGVGEAGAYPNMARVQSNWLPAKSRARAGGLLWLVARFGGALSPILFGWLLRFFDSPNLRLIWINVGLLHDLPAWRPAFWTAGLIGALWCLAFYAWFHDDPAKAPAVNAQELRLIQADGSPSAARQRMTRQTWLALLKCRSLWALGILYLCGSFGWSFFVTWLPKYMEQVHGVQFERSELMSGLPLFCGGISCLLGGVLSDALVKRLRHKWLARALFPMIGYTIAAVAMLCVPWARNPAEAVTLMCLASAGNDFGQGANWATIVDVGGRHAGVAAGFINMVGNSGNWIQPYVGAVIFASVGWNALMGLYGAAFLCAALMWLFIDPRRPFHAEDVPHQSHHSP